MLSFLLRSQIQIALLQNHWLPLFLLSLIQCSSIINLPHILSTLLSSKKTNFEFISTSFLLLEKLDNNELNKWFELRRIQSLLYEFERLHINDMEYAYLKLISVFNPSNNNGKK